MHLDAETFVNRTFIEKVLYVDIYTHIIKCQICQKLKNRFHNLSEIISDN